MDNALNNGINPLKIVRVSDTRWLNIQVAICRILYQWEDLKDHFKIVGTQEHCYKAKTLYNMYSGHNNLLYLTFLRPILTEVQHINLMFQSNSVDRAKLLDDLVLLIQSLAKKVVTPCCKEDLLKVNIKEYLNLNSYLGYEFEERLKIIRNKILTDTEKVIRRICVNFIVTQRLVTQLQSRLPSNLNLLKNIFIFSPEKCLNVIKPSIVALAEGMDFLVEDVPRAKAISVGKTELGEVE